MLLHMTNAPDNFLGPGCGDKFSPLPVPVPLLAFGPSLPSAFYPAPFVEPLCTGSSRWDHPVVLPAFHKSQSYGAAEKRRITDLSKAALYHCLERTGSDKGPFLFTFFRIN